MNNLSVAAGYQTTLAQFRTMLKQKMGSLNDSFESCTWYRDHWTEGQRHIIRAAKGEF